MQTKEIHKGNIPPTDISMVWIDTTDPENIQVKVFLNGKWTTAADAPSMMPVTWAELKEFRDEGHLIPGLKYRITDYVATTSKKGTKSANHPFDIIVTADDERTLNENAKAILNESDNYFSVHQCNLEAWEIKYCLDNDYSRFDWAVPDNFIIVDKFNEPFIRDTTHDAVGGHTQYYAWKKVNGDLIIYTESETPNRLTDFAYNKTLPPRESYGIFQTGISGSGKGIIYHMKDEHNNEATYDFKNILFLRYLINMDKPAAVFSDSGTTSNSYKDIARGYIENVDPADLSVASMIPYFDTASKFQGGFGYITGDSIMDADPGMYEDVDGDTLYIPGLASEGISCKYFIPIVNNEEHWDYTFNNGEEECVDNTVETAFVSKFNKLIPNSLQNYYTRYKELPNISVYGHCSYNNICGYNIILYGDYNNINATNTRIYGNDIIAKGVSESYLRSTYSEYFNIEASLIEESYNCILRGVFNSYIGYSNGCDFIQINDSSINANYANRNGTHFYNSTFKNIQDSVISLIVFDGDMYDAFIVGLNKENIDLDNYNPGNGHSVFIGTDSNGTLVGGNIFDLMGSDT